MFGFRSATVAPRRLRLPRARAEQQTRSYATLVTSPPLPVPRPGSRAASSPPGAGRTPFQDDVGRTGRIGRALLDARRRWIIGARVQLSDQRTKDFRQRRTRHDHRAGRAVLIAPNNLVKRGIEGIDVMKPRGHDRAHTPGPRDKRRDRRWRRLIRPTGAATSEQHQRKKSGTQNHPTHFSSCACSPQIRGRTLAGVSGIVQHSKAGWRLSVTGQSRPCRSPVGAAAMPPITDINADGPDVRSGPTADVIP
jgi:hypothetical protein